MSVQTYTAIASAAATGLVEPQNLSDEERKAHWTQWLTDWGEMDAASSAAVRVTPANALTYATIWQAVNTIAGDVAQLPLVLYEREDERNKQRATSHPAYLLMRRRCNAYMSAFTFVHTLQAHALLWGNGYAEIERNGAGQPLALWPLMPDRTEPRFDDAERLWYVTRVGNEQRKLRPENVFHVHGLGFDGIRGYSVVSLARESFGLSMAGEKFANRSLKHGARPSGVLKATRPLPKDESKVKALRDQWRRMNEGIDAAGRTMILEEGMEWQQISMSNKDAQFLELREFQRSEIASWFLLPPHKVGDLRRATFSNIEQQSLDYLNMALMRWLVTWQDECNEKLLTVQQKRADSHYFEFLTAAFLRGDFPSQVNALAGAITARIINPNEARGVLNMNAYDGGDEFLNPNITPSGSAAADAPADPVDAQNRLGELLRVEVRRVVHAAAKTANFVGWLDSFYARWGGTLADVLAELGLSPDRATSHVNVSRQALLEAAGRATTREELADEVRGITASWPGRVTALAAA